MPTNPLVIVHGYSDSGDSFRKWAGNLQKKRGGFTSDINICTWISLSNEITIKDVADGFDRALRSKGLAGKPFDAIVHSTGMLVVRSWLAEHPDQRLGQLKRLIALAPATFGSPLAHEGRSVLGSIFKGDHTMGGPDFMAAGDLILDALELGSSFTWKLAHRDLLNPGRQFYGLGSDTPYIFVFCGSSPYSGPRSLINKPGTDGTIRWAGCSLNAEKFTFDLRRGPGAPTGASRWSTTNGLSHGRLPINFWPINDVNHGTIVSDPPDSLVDLVYKALQVDSPQDFESWQKTAAEITGPALKKLEDDSNEWQQFIVHAVDHRGDPILDFHLEICGIADGGETEKWGDGNLDSYAYSGDKSFRCYHINISKLRTALKQRAISKLRARIIASSGSAWVDYHGEGSEVLPAGANEVNVAGKWDAIVDIPIRFDAGPEFFYPFTTTLIEVILERDPLPFGIVENKLCRFI